MRLLLELYCVIVIKHVAFFTSCVKLTMTFTFTSLPLNSYTQLLFPDVLVVNVSALNKNLCRSTDLAKKRHGSADLHTPIHPTFVEKYVFIPRPL